MSPLDRHTQTQPIRLTGHLERLIAAEGGDGPITRQYRPSPFEDFPAADDRPDPIGDAAHSPLKGVVRRYPDRALLMPVAACAAYCRFCFRRETVGRAPAALTPDEMAAALDYIRATPALWEIILTGGDPLILSPDRLGALLADLEAIPHVQTIRIHSRLPLMDPGRLSDDHIAALTERGKPLWLALHVNHAAEITPEVAERVAALRRADVPLLAQTVLLKGVNDDAETLEVLFRRLVTIKVKPYYLHHCDPAPGNAHFRVPVETGRAIMRALKARLSGLALPTYVQDTPEGVGKLPIL